MYTNSNLQNYLETSSTVNSRSLIVAEWNMNLPENILKMGNYRYRPYLVSGKYSEIASVFDINDVDGNYTGATESHIAEITGISALTQEPTILSSKSQKEDQLYSLLDTVGRFRPRSGINKIRFFGDNFMNYPNTNMDVQPRFYLSSKDDIFKYWTSYRVETDRYSDYPNVNHNVERGVGKTKVQTGEYLIDDAAPFVVYKTPVPANRIVVKMQTGVGDYDLSPNGAGYKKNNNETMQDPFYEDPLRVFPYDNQKTPVAWKIQYLDASNNWITATSFLYDTYRKNFTRVIGADGYVEIAYGITNSPLPFKLIGEFASQYSLPLDPAIGDAYIVPDATGATSGMLYVWSGTEWSSVVPEYGWYLAEQEQDISTSRVTNLTDPEYFGTVTSKYSPTYREFQYIKGIRIVAETVSQLGASLDLIEMSPRLVSDITDNVVNYKVTKIASDIGNTGVPVGQLLASTGSLDIFDYSQIFNEYNYARLESGKIVGSLLYHMDSSNNLFEISSRNLQVKIYEEIIDDRSFPTVNHYFVPVKTMYVDGVPQINGTERKVSLSLRDLFFYFESINAPRILLRNITTSYAIAMLLDNIGFSNYKFFRNQDEKEDKIPYFFIPPDTNVAQVLNSIAQSTQTAMFFDENNNFVTMSRNYIMPTSQEQQDKNRPTLTMYGTKDYAENGAIKNQSLNAKLSNIISVDSEDNLVYNGGKITYINRYIQKSYSSIKEASMLNRSQSYKHKPVLLWEVSGTEALRPVNDEVSNQSAYSLSALSLNADLTDQLPYVDSNGVIQNNIIDFGQSIYWLTRYKGYLYANSEIIKYDAVEHTVSGIGDVWIEDISDYQKYFSKIPFNGKMFPTGRVRIYAEPKFNTDGTVMEGAVAKHGRMQFGTGVKVSDSNGNVTMSPAKHTILSNSNPWMDESARKTFLMKSEYMFQGEHQYSETAYFKNVNTTAGSPVLTGVDTNSLKTNFFIHSYKFATVKVATPGYEAGNIVRIETTAAHKFKANEMVRITGVAPDVYNGDFKIISVDGTHFKVKNEKIAASTTIDVSGKAEILYNKDVTDDWANSIFPEGTVIKSIGTAAYTNISGTVSATTGSGPWTATVTTKQSLNLTVGQPLTQVIAGTGSLYGGSPTSVVVASVISENKFTYTVTGGTTPVNGTVSNFTVGNGTTSIVVLSANATKTTTDSTVAFTNRKVETLLNDPYTVKYVSNKPNVDTLVKDFFDSSNYLESSSSTSIDKTKPNGSLKSSALIVTGPGNVKPDKPIDVIAFSGNGTEITFETTSPNGLQKADTVFVSGLSENNGSYVIESVTDDSFTVIGTNQSTMREESGKAEKQLSAYNDVLSYVSKSYASVPSPESFGTRVRIVGKPVVSSKDTANEVTQIPLGSEMIQTVYKDKESYDIQGTGAGIAINMSSREAKISGYSGAGTYLTDGKHSFKVGDSVAISGMVSQSDKIITGVTTGNNQVRYAVNNKDGSFEIGNTISVTGMLATVKANVTFAKSAVVGSDLIGTYYLDKAYPTDVFKSGQKISVAKLKKAKSGGADLNIAKASNKTILSVTTGDNPNIKKTQNVTIITVILGGAPYKAGKSDGSIGVVYSLDGSSSAPNLNCSNQTIVDASPTYVSILRENAVGESVVDANNWGVNGSATSTGTNGLNSYSAEITAISDSPPSFTIASPSLDTYVSSINGLATGDSPVGYYFEIVALTSSTITDTSDSNGTSETIPNVYFYKVMKGDKSKEAVPYVLWYGSAAILVDDGLFVGQAKSITSSTPTVYDLSMDVEDTVEVVKQSDGKEITKEARSFHLYINGNLVQTVTDDNPIKVTDENKNVALFVRGRGKALFEHVYVVGESQSQPSQNKNSPLTNKTAFFDEKLDNVNYRRYLMNPSVLKTYIQGIGKEDKPKYDLYFEEFGTIMRECAYFNIRYDKAYPALYSKISPTFNDSQGYVVSNFRANPYGAEFLIFNATDFALNLDESTGNYLRIQGVTFTQQSSHDLTVDEYFSKVSDSDNFENYYEYNQGFKELQNSRTTYGKKDFTISGDYIQNIDTANSLMKWMSEKVMKKRKSVRLSIFANPMIQLGDIVEIQYDVDNTQQVSDSRFIVYHIDYERDQKGPRMTIYLSEVI